MYFVSSSEGKIIDSRRKVVETPKEDDLIVKMKDIKKPSGESYEFLKEETTSMAQTNTTSVEREKCFFQVVQGTVVKQDFAKFETSIKKAFVEKIGDGEYSEIYGTYRYHPYCCFVVLLIKHRVHFRSGL